MASEAAWLKTVPRAMADGLTGGRSALEVSLSVMDFFNGVIGVDREPRHHTMGVVRRGER